MEFLGQQTTITTLNLKNNKTMEATYINLTPKEMAQYLIKRFGEPCIYISIEPRDIDCSLNETHGGRRTSIEIALIAVDVILNTNPCEAIYGKYEVSYSPVDFYWQEVKEELKQELEKR